MGTYTRKKPWALLPDGDLWAMIEEAIEAKGQHAVRFSWGRGHASIFAMDALEVCIKHSISNGYADLAADEGHAQFNRGDLKALAAFLAAKQQSSVQLFSAILRRIGRVQEAVAKRIEDAQACSAAEREASIPAPPIPSYVDFELGHCFVFREYPITGLTAEEKAKHIGLRIFWSNLRFQTVTMEEGGTTWLELFALWHSRCGCEKQVSANDRRPTFRKSLADFMSRSKALFSHGDAGTKAFTRACKAKATPLAPYGITNSIPMLSAKVVLQPGLAAKLHSMICSVLSGKSGPISPSHKLKVGMLRMPKFPPWLHLCSDPPLPALVSLRLQGMSEAQVLRCQGGACLPRPSSFELACPRCSVVCDAANRSLFHPGHNTQLWCSSCKHATSSKRWSCSCGHGWMDCPIHRPLGFLCKARLSLKKRASPGLTQGLFHGSAKRRRTTKLGELGVTASQGAWPPPPLAPPWKKLKPSLPIPSGSPGPPGAAGPLCPSPKNINHELSQALLIRLHAHRPAGRPASLGNPPGPGPSFVPGPSALSYRPPSKPYARPACKIAHVTCVSGNGQCPASGWTIDQYCLKCHG